MTPVLGGVKTEAVLGQVTNLENVANVRDSVRSLLTA